MNTDILLRAFGHIYREGLSLTSALARENIPKSSYYHWRSNNIDMDMRLKLEAQALAAIEVDLERARAERMREVQRLHIEEVLLGGVAPVLEKLLTAARDAGNLQEQVSALRELRQWLSAGILGSPDSSAAENLKALAPPSLPDFLAGGQVNSISVESLSGDKITLERGQVIQGAVTEETPVPS